MLKKHLQAIVLAAGKSKRFNTGTSKQVAALCGKPMIIHVLSTLKKLNIPIGVVVGSDAHEIINCIEEYYDDITTAYQAEQCGTGHAVLCSKPLWNQDFLLIMNGDMPLISSSILEDLIDHHSREQAHLSFIASTVFDPSGYGRVVCEQDSITIVEDKECTKKQREIQLINAGVYLISRSLLQEALETLTSSDRTGEYYFTDVVRYAHENKYKVSYQEVSFDRVHGVNTLEDLWEVEQIKCSEIVRHWMTHGVRFIAPSTNHIDCDVIIESGTIIHAGVQLRGKTYIGRDCLVDCFSVLSNATIEDNSQVHPHSVISDSHIGQKSSIGPFAHVRENAILAGETVIGNFVEIKKSSINTRTKIKHLAYIGDATIGKEVNIGAGSIICNYDGIKKEKTEIQDNVFVGSNSTLVAPLTIEKESFVAAGSTITKDVKKHDLAIARARQENKEGYAKKLLKKSKSSSASSSQGKKYFIGAYRTSGYPSEKT